MKRHALTNALRVAALQYQTDAEVHRVEPVGGGLMPPDGRARLGQAFEDQAIWANAMADLIEEADFISLED